MPIVISRTAQQVIRREDEKATLYERRPLNSNGLGGGFAPRQLRRSVNAHYFQ